MSDLGLIAAHFLTKPHICGHAAPPVRPSQTDLPMPAGEETATSTAFLA
jgi:hypothetical protein